MSLKTQNIQLYTAVFFQQLKPRRLLWCFISCFVQSGMGQQICWEIGHCLSSTNPSLELNVFDYRLSYHGLFVCFSGCRSLLRPWCRLRWRAAPRCLTSTTLVRRRTWRSPPSSTWRLAYPPWATPSVSPSRTEPSSPAPADTFLSEYAVQHFVSCYPQVQSWAKMITLSPTLLYCKCIFYDLLHDNSHTSTRTLFVPPYCTVLILPNLFLPQWLTFLKFLTATVSVTDSSTDFGHTKYLP